MSWTNEDRANRARDAIAAYIMSAGDDPSSNDEATWLQDLLCDLRHYAHQERIDFHRANANAQWAHSDECDEEEGA